MRKLIGLCFLTATLLASSAHAQGIFIDRGDPSAISATVSGGLVDGRSWAVAWAASWTYRGVFDAGGDCHVLRYTAGTNKNLSRLPLDPVRDLACAARRRRTRCPSRCLS